MEDKRAQFKRTLHKMSISLDYLQQVIREMERSIDSTSKEDIDMSVEKIKTLLASLTSAQQSKGNGWNM